MPHYYPIHLDLEGKKCLVVGGGAVAERRVGGLLEAGAAVIVISPVLSLALAEWQRQGSIQVIETAYEPSALDSVVLVVAATNVREVNAQIIADAKARGVLVNAADAPEEGDYIVPSLVRRGELCLSLSTGGNNPLLSARLAAELEARFGPEYADYVELLGQIRLYIKERTADRTLRRQALLRLLEGEALLLDSVRAGSHVTARALAEEMVEAVLSA